MALVRRSDLEAWISDRNRIATSVTSARAVRAIRALVNKERTYDAIGRMSRSNGDANQISYHAPMIGARIATRNRSEWSPPLEPRQLPK